MSDEMSCKECDNWVETTTVSGAKNGVCILRALAIIQGAYESGFPSDWPKAMAGAHTMPCIKAEKVENRS